MKYKSNASYGFHPGLLRPRQRRGPTYNRRVASMLRKARGKSVPTGTSSSARSDVEQALVGQGYKPKIAKDMAKRAKGSDFGSMFRSAMSLKNPGLLDALGSLSSIQSLGKGMSKKKKSRKKKKNSPRKGVMPPGLKKYWAKKRAKKNGRRRKTKRNPKRHIRYRTRTVVKYRYRTKKRNTRKHAKRNPPQRKHVKIIQAPRGMSGKALRRFARQKGMEYGAPARIIKK